MWPVTAPMPWRLYPLFPFQHLLPRLQPLFLSLASPPTGTVLPVQPGTSLDISVDNFSSFISGFNSSSEGGTSQIVTGLDPGTTYQYRVRAINAANASNNSNVISIVTMLSPPVATTATSISSTGFTANWNSVSSATGYQLDISTDNFSTFISGYNSGSVAGTTQIVIGLIPGTTYQYRVRAINGSGASANSNVISFCITPATPTISLTNGNTATPTLTSSASSGNQWFLNGTAISGAVGNTLNVTVSGMYSVQTTTVGGCTSALSANFPVIVTGDISMPANLCLYPNPSHDYVFITGIRETVIELAAFDMMGRSLSIKLEQYSEMLLGDISYLTSGVYILKVTEGSRVHQIKFVKN